MARSEAINVRFEPAEMEALEKAAAAENRSKSWLIQQAVVGWLRDREAILKRLPAAAERRSK